MISFLMLKISANSNVTPNRGVIYRLGRLKWWLSTNNSL